MNVDVKCVCGRVHEVTPLIPKGDDGVYVPFDALRKVKPFKDGKVDSIWRGGRAVSGCSANIVTCECGKAFSVAVEIWLEGIQYQLCRIESPGGKQIHATYSETDATDGSRWRTDTYLYREDNGQFYFEQYNRNQHQTTLWLASEELREYVVKLLPLLFTPEEVKKLLSGQGLPPASKG